MLAGRHFLHLILTGRSWQTLLLVPSFQLSSTGFRCSPASTPPTSHGRCTTVGKARAPCSDPQGSPSTTRLGERTKPCPPQAAAPPQSTRQALCALSSSGSSGVPGWAGQASCPPRLQLQSYSQWARAVLSSDAAGVPGPGGRRGGLFFWTPWVLQHKSGRGSYFTKTACKVKSKH